MNSYTIKESGSGECEEFILNMNMTVSFTISKKINNPKKYLDFKCLNKEFILNITEYLDNFDEIINLMKTNKILKSILFVPTLTLNNNNAEHDVYTYSSLSSNMLIRKYWLHYWKLKILKILNKSMSNNNQYNLEIKANAIEKLYREIENFNKHQNHIDIHNLYKYFLEIFSSDKFFYYANVKISKYRWPHILRICKIYLKVFDKNWHKIRNNKYYCMSQFIYLLSWIEKNIENDKYQNQNIIMSSSPLNNKSDIDDDDNDDTHFYNEKSERLTKRIDLQKKISHYLGTRISEYIIAENDNIKEVPKSEALLFSSLGFEEEIEMEVNFYSFAFYKDYPNDPNIELLSNEQLIDLYNVLKHINHLTHMIPWFACRNSRYYRLNLNEDILLVKVITLFINRYFAKTLDDQNFINLIKNAFEFIHNNYQEDDIWKIIFKIFNQWTDNMNIEQKIVIILKEEKEHKIISSSPQKSPQKSILYNHGHFCEYKITSSVVDSNSDPDSDNLVIHRTFMNFLEKSMNLETLVEYKKNKEDIWKLLFECYLVWKPWHKFISNENFTIINTKYTHYRNYENIINSRSKKS
jgi:hypothetical protein